MVDKPAKNRNGEKNPGPKADEHWTQNVFQFLSDWNTALNYLFTEHWFFSIILGGAFGLTAGVTISRYLSSPLWGAVVGAGILGLVILLTGAHVWRKRPQPIKPLSNAAVQFPEALKATFKQLRNSFESLALKSNGLYHVLEERQQGLGIPPPSADDLVPPGISTKPDHPNTILQFASPPGDPAQPVALSEQEAAAAPPPKDGEWIIRDGGGRALAQWRPAIIRMGYTYGDHAVLQQFDNLAKAAGNALRGIPDEIVLRLPESIRSLCREHVTIAREYRFGTVPPGKYQWVQGGWNPSVLTFECGTIVQHVEPGTGGDSPSSAWLLLLHRIGWDAPAGSPYLASKKYWHGNMSCSIDFPLHFPDGPGIKDMPRHRTYSILGPKDSSAADVCWASVWAIDRLLSLMNG